MRFSERNRRRSESPSGFGHKLDSWSLSDWLTATMGELGEAANLVKKLNRVRDGIPGNSETPEQLRANLADELADVAIYLDLIIQAAGFDPETIREAKFAKTSRKIGYVEPHTPRDELMEAMDTIGSLLARNEKLEAEVTRLKVQASITERQMASMVDPHEGELWWTRTKVNTDLDTPTHGLAPQPAPEPPATSPGTG